MSGVVEAILGPLIGPECRRSLGRGWIILVRCLAGTVAGCVVLVLLWFWWISQSLTSGGGVFSPHGVLLGGIVALEVMAVGATLVLSPALIAGSLAGAQERGALGLLLTTRLRPWEIVVGRMAGKLCQVAQVLLAGIPFLILLGALAGLDLATGSILVFLPGIVAFGVGGIALAASAVSRRGRDALLSVYLVVLLFLLSVLLDTSLSPTAFAWIVWLNPFSALEPLFRAEDAIPALRTMVGWGLLGLSGIALAVWQLRPSCLRLLSGEDAGRRSRRRGRIPPVSQNRPMIWKERYVEHAGSLGRVGRWIGLVIVAWMGLGSTIYAGLIARDTWIVPNANLAEEWRSILRYSNEITAWWLSALIQLAIGLRAAVGIASERERETWDSLLTSPLDGREILIGKLSGSLHALRWLLAATLYTWTLALIVGAMDTDWFLYLVMSTLASGAFMAMLGVRTSLDFATATRSMAVTVGIWLLALAAVAAFAAMIVLVAAALIMYIWWRTTGALAFSGTGVTVFPITFETGFQITQITLYALLAAVIAIESWLRFDRIAGRLSGGAVEVALDQAFHGRPTAPVRIGPVAVASTSPDRVGDRPEG